MRICIRLHCGITAEESSQMNESICSDRGLVTCHSFADITAEELVASGSQYELAPEAFWSAERLLGGDGYDMMSVAAKFHWRSIASWGRAGYDAGGWPYVVLYQRFLPAGDAGPNWQLAYYVEGDVQTWRFPTRALLHAAIDALVLFHWKADSEPWVVGLETVEQLPPQLRGPFSWNRLDEEQPGWLNKEASTNG